MNHPDCPKCGKPMAKQFDVNKGYRIPDGTSESPPQIVERSAFRCAACNVNVTVDSKGKVTIDPSS